LRGEQTGAISVFAARTEHARITLTLGTVLMNFWTADAAQGVAEGIAAARNALAPVPSAVAPTTDPYPSPTIAVDWTKRPAYAVVPQSRLAADRRRTLRWVDVPMGPITWQLLDRVAHRSLSGLLIEVHRTAVAVCLDGHAHSNNPDADDYVPTWT